MIINRLPIGGGSDLTIFKWLEDGVVDTSLCGGFEGYKESNGKNNLSTMETDGYLHFWASSGSYGQTRIFSQNYIPKGVYDCAMVHVLSNSDVGSIRNVTGFATAKSATTTATSTACTLGNVYEGTPSWWFVPFSNNNNGQASYYFTMGGAVDCKIDKIYFAKFEMVEGSSYVPSLTDFITASANTFDGFSLHTDVIELQKTTSGEKHITLTNNTQATVRVRVIFNQNGWNSYSANVLGETGSSANTTVELAAGSTYTITASGNAQNSGSYMNIFIFRTALF